MASEPIPLPDLEEALVDSEFEEASNCIAGVFEKLDLKTIEDLENSVPYLTCSFCMVNTHKLIDYLRDYQRGEVMATEELIDKAPPVEPFQSQEEE